MFQSIAALFGASQAEKLAQDQKAPCESWSREKPPIGNLDPKRPTWAQNTQPTPTQLQPNPSEPMESQVYFPNNDQKAKDIAVLMQRVEINTQVLKDFKERKTISPAYIKTLQNIIKNDKKKIQILESQPSPQDDEEEFLMRVQDDGSLQKLVQEIHFNRTTVS